MPTVLSHIAVPLALGIGLGNRVISARLVLAGVAASVVPDLDVLAFRLGIPYADSLGHRGASHSLAVAVLLGVLALAFSRGFSSSRVAAFLFVGVSAASHGLLDMLTNGGHGVALWWPVSQERLFFPWAVIEASPLSLRRIASGKGLEVLRSELLWVWLPATISCAVLLLVRRWSNPSIERTASSALRPPEAAAHVER
jgi:inner membrane protein